jgi:hypothetical protein
MRSPIATWFVAFLVGASFSACSSKTHRDTELPSDSGVGPDARASSGAGSDARGPSDAGPDARGPSEAGSDARASSEAGSDARASSEAGSDARGPFDAGSDGRRPSDAGSGSSADGNADVTKDTGGGGDGQGFPNLKHSVKPAVKNGGFRMAGFNLWCPSVMKVGDTYHLFASRWPYTAGKGLSGWLANSECVRATSSSLHGPYTFAEVVLHGRAGQWDAMVHNPKIVKQGDTYIIYYIHGAMETGYAYSSSITGPWTRIDTPPMALKNPAPLVRPTDNSIYVLGLNKASIPVPDEHGHTYTLYARGYTASTFLGPYTLLNGVTLPTPKPHAYEMEDPCIWWANNQYNVVALDWNGWATGVIQGGVQYYSRDGRDYRLVSTENVFTGNTAFADGSTVKFARRERPFVYVENERAIALFTAGIESVTSDKGPARIVVNPVDNYYPGVSP